MVLRCDDCVAYHIGQCIESSCTKDEIVEAMSVALVVGGTIVVPHMRRAIAFMDEMLEDKAG
jgi:alkylhydroperoxidase/carboxymuconolactone decarboxylase family protein YurZ